jgi:hypothetical protein
MKKKRGKMFEKKRRLDEVVEAMKYDVLLDC